MSPSMLGFNTASGKCYCNSYDGMAYHNHEWFVSIPQAVSAIAINNCRHGAYGSNVSIPQAVSAIAIGIETSR